jgi:hypothetical protein
MPGTMKKPPHKAGPKVSGWHPCRAGDLSTLSRASSVVYGPSGYTFATADERRNRDGLG